MTLHWASTSFKSDSLPRLIRHAVFAHGPLVYIFGGLKEDSQGETGATSDLWRLKLTRESTPLTPPPRGMGMGVWVRVWVCM